MSDRIEKMIKRVRTAKYSICSEVARLTTESWKETEGEPNVIRTAKAQANILDKIPIFIQEGEPIVGNGASKPMAVESWAITGWMKEGIDALREEGWEISNETEAQMASLNEYWGPRSAHQKYIDSMDEDRLWPFLQSGWMIPPQMNREWASKIGFASSGLGVGLSLPEAWYTCVPLDKMINRGLTSLIQEAEQEKRNLNFNDAGTMEKAHFLEAVIIAHKAVIRWANRYADLATAMAAEEKDPTRKKELERIAQTCRWVPANPARDFYEAIQYLWFLYVILASLVMPLQRFDQYMYPFYKKDIREGTTTDEKVLELLQCLRIKDMEIMGVAGSAHRQKWSGLAKWNNMVIGGVTPDGDDATSELTYLILEAAMRCQTPHHTITLRVHEGTPEALMLKALELVKTGIGMPAFVGDKSYIESFVSKDVPLKVARDYYLIGCLDGTVPEGMGNLFPMCATTVAWSWLVNNGMDPFARKQVGLATGDFESFETFDDLMGALKKQIAHGMAMEAECRGRMFETVKGQFPDAFVPSLFTDGIKVGKSTCDRTLPYKIGHSMGPVGMTNMADSLAAIKKLVFDEKKVTLKELKAALAANWEGYEEIRAMCLKAPKYGNDDDYVDSIVSELYRFYAETAGAINGPRGKYNATAISISAHQVAGMLLGATPDGRYSGESLADGSVSPSQGKDTFGPTAAMNSAAKIDQTAYLATLMNMKLNPSALSSTEGMKNLSALIKTYFSLGGKHIQFNVVSKETLLDAQKRPEKHRDLIVRVAGYSAYYIQLSEGVQEEIIHRMEHAKSA